MTAKWGKKGKEVVGGNVPASAGEPQRISNKLEKVLVAESALPSHKQRAKVLLRRITGYRHFKIIAAALGVVIIFSGIGIYLGARDEEKPVEVASGPACTYAILEKAKPNLGYTKIEKLKPQVEEIEKIPGYDKDANCLAVATTYYINISDAKKSRAAYDKLVQAYDPLEGYETVIRGAVHPPDTLKGNVEFLEKQAAFFAEAADNRKGQKVNPETGEPIIE